MISLLINFQLDHSRFKNYPFCTIFSYNGKSNIKFFADMVERRLQKQPAEISSWNFGGQWRAIIPELTFYDRFGSRLTIVSSTEIECKLTDVGKEHYNLIKITPFSDVNRIKYLETLFPVKNA
jgi:hypothetical protein